MGCDKDFSGGMEVNCFLFGFLIKGCNEILRLKFFYLGGNVWGVD